MKHFKNVLSSFVHLGVKGAVQLTKDGFLPPEIAWELIQAEAFLVDVRSPKEYSAGTLLGSINIPHTEVEARVEEFGSDKSRLILVYCAVGGRSALAKTFLDSNGFQEVHNAGGYDDLIVFGTKNGFC